MSRTQREPHVIPREIAPSAALSTKTPRQVAQELRRLLERGASFHCPGEAGDDPDLLLAGGYLPKRKVELFGVRFYLTYARASTAVRYMVAYVAPAARGRTRVYARIFYKDLSLVWRCASHMIANDDTFWIGKGATRIVEEGDHQLEESNESTTDLPFELQDALEAANRRVGRIRVDEEAFWYVLKNAPEDRVQPYRDFMAPRHRAMQHPANRIHRGHPIAAFERDGDPSSLVFVPGYEPDLESGVVERTASFSGFYGGALSRYRVLSRNREVQYLFFHGPKHVWMANPQSTTTELSSFGVRTVDVAAPDDLCVPGYEYHYADDDDPTRMISQVPEGYVGEPHPDDDTRADASPWLERLPVIRAFRRRVLGA